MRHIEIHALQTLPPSRINRGENGEPKTSLLGGVPRTRVSSQSQKRQQRQLTQTRRTRVPHEMILRELGDDSLRDITADLMGLRYGKYDDNQRLKTMVYLDTTEVVQFAELIKKNAENLLRLRGRIESDLKGSDLKAATKDYQEALAEVLNDYMPRTSEDTALFGRFMADVKNENIQAATSYSHAISVHRDQTVADFFSSMDDYLDENAHIGNVGLTAPTLYRYATLDLDLLGRHLKGMTPEQLRDVVERWITGFLFATPAGGAHGAFARTLPEYVLITFRDSGHPVTLANAFTEPAYPNNGQSQLRESVRKLKSQAAFNQTAFGVNGLQQALELSLHDVPTPGLNVTRHSVLAEALKDLPL